MAVTRAVTRAVLPGFTTLDNVCGCIKREQVSNQQVRMMPAKFLWPWEVLVLDISELEQDPEAKKKCQMAVVDTTVNSTLLSSTPYCCRGILIYVARYMELVIRNDAGRNSRYRW